MASDPVWSIARLTSSHDRTHFDCGQDALNTYLANLARQWEKKGLARTYVATRPDDARVLGYYTLSSGAVTHEAVPAPEQKGLPQRVHVHVILLGRLAVDRSAQGQGLGGTLLVDALRRCEWLSEQLGIRAVEVHAKDDAARGFYEHYGFVSLEDDRLHLYLPIKTIRQLNLPPLR